MDQSHPIVKVGGELYAIPTAEECRMINKACDEFWLKRGLQPQNSGFQFLDFRKNSSTKPEESENADKEQDAKK